MKRTPTQGYIEGFPRHTLTVQAETRLRLRADEATKLRLDAVDEAHRMLCDAVVNFKPYNGWNLWRSYKEWRAFKKVYRVSDYLYCRGFEVLQTGGTRPLSPLMLQVEQEYEW
jgi:radical SAM superfamily enzyme YgiQ (UPF0313 family)